MADNNTVLNIDPEELAAKMAMDNGKSRRASQEQAKVEAAGEASLASESVEETTEAAPEPTKVKRERSQKYVQARSMVDRTQFYSVEDAIELVKRTSYSAFDGTITAHINMKKELKPTDVKMPHAAGKKVRVGIIDDALLAEFDAGNFDYDVLVATPDMMKKVAKYARVLGPKGLMPNPKTGTITTDPQAKKAALEGGSMTLRSERKAPLVHVTIGKTSQPTQEIAENLQAILNATKSGTVLKVTLAPTMGPGVKVSL